MVPRARPSAATSTAPEGSPGELQKQQLQLGLRLIRAISGERPSPPLEDVVERIAPRPTLLIASGHGPRGEGQRIYRDAAGSPAQLWVIPDAAHTGGLRKHPGEYEQRTIAFLDHVL